MSQNKSEEKNGWVVRGAEKDGQYDSYIESSYKKILDLQISRCNLKQGDLILEVGCATGSFAKRLSANSFRVIGVDIAFRLVCLAPNGAFTAMAADGELLPFKKNVFDHVCCYDLLHPFHDPDKLIGEMVWILKPTGSIFISDLNGINPHTFLAQTHWSPVRYDYLNTNESASFPWKLARYFRKYGKKAEIEYSFLERRKKLHVSDWKYKVFGFITTQIDGFFKRLLAIILFNYAHIITNLLPLKMKSNIIIAYWLGENNKRLGGK